MVLTWTHSNYPQAEVLGLDISLIQPHTWVLVFCLATGPIGLTRGTEFLPTFLFDVEILISRGMACLWIHGWVADTLQ